MQRGDSELVFGWRVGGGLLSGGAHCGSVWVVVNGSPATITIETCEDPGDWTTAIAGTGPAGQGGFLWVVVWGRRCMQGFPGRGAGGPGVPPGGGASMEGGVLPPGPLPLTPSSPCLPVVRGPCGLLCAAF